jgi:hypothetical protein
VAWLFIIPTRFGTNRDALAAAGVPVTAWHGDGGVRDAVGSVPGSLGAGMLADGDEAIPSLTSAPGTAALHEVSEVRSFGHDVIPARLGLDFGWWHTLYKAAGPP